jgi:two-component system response regulator NreC
MASHLHLAPAASATYSGTSPEPQIRVVLADDHALMRRSLRLLLEREQGLEVVAEAGDLATAIDDVAELRPDVLLLDLSMPDGSSIEAVRQLRDSAPSTEIVILTMEDSAVFAQEALDSGAVGFVLKDFADVELNRAARAAARGEQYVSPRVAARLDSARRAVNELTVR